MCSAAFRTFSGPVLPPPIFSAVLTVICRDSMSPTRADGRYTSRGYLPASGDRSFKNVRERGSDFLFLPLRWRAPRESSSLRTTDPTASLHYRMTPVTFADWSHLIFDFYQISRFFDVSDQRLSAVKRSIPSYLPARSFIVASSLRQDHLGRSCLSPTKIVRVMSRRDLYGAGALFRIRIRIRDDKGLSFDDRNDNLLADHVAYLSSSGFTATAQSPNIVSGREVATTRPSPPSAPGISHNNISRFLPWCSTSASDRGSAFRTPVDQTVAAVNQALFIQIDESPDDSSAAALVQRKSLSLPVAGAAQLLTCCDRAAVFFLPGPGSLQELFSAQLFFFFAFFFPDLFHYFYFCGDAGVVGARNPECVTPASCGNGSADPAASDPAHDPYGVFLRYSEAASRW